MSTLVKPTVVPEPMAARVTDDTLSVDLADGRTIAVPLGWFPRLLHGTPAERSRYELSYGGVHWPDLDEDIPVEGLLNGCKSGESLTSIQRWLEYRSRGEREPVRTLPLPSEMDEELKKIRAEEL
ncbi:MAG: DUF2442 domain-containing protein [Chthoniobacterales bacterium]|nr:DUF2442 domain-containing protein [Chthoniobacterales bacterium]